MNIYEYVKASGGPPSSMAVLSGTLRNEQKIASSKISELFPGKKILNWDLGAVIGSHLGPELLTLLWF